MCKGEDSRSGGSVRKAELGKVSSRNEWEGSMNERQAGRQVFLWRMSGSVAEMGRRNSWVYGNVGKVIHGLGVEVCARDVKIGKPERMLRKSH